MPESSEPTPVNILLVDDRPENLAALKAILNSPDYRLVAVTSGKEALEVALRERFALILLDVVMPEMDGFEVAAHLKTIERTRHIPILFLTAVATDIQHIYRAYEAGAVDYLIKPLDNEVVRKKATVFVDLFRQREEIGRQAELLAVAERREFALRLAELRMASDRRYRKLAAGIDYAIAWAMDSHLRLSFVSGQAPRVLGFPIEEFLEPDFWERHLHPDDREAFLALCQGALLGEGEADLHLSHRVVAADGRVLWFHTSVSGERFNGAELHGISVDVTDLKHAEGIKALFAEVTGVLSESLDYRLTLPKVPRCVLPSLGDWCLIDETVDSHLRGLAVAHVDPGRETWLRGLERQPMVDVEAPSGIGHVFATRRAELHREVSDVRWLAEALGFEQAEALRTTAANSCMFVPLVARERVMGVLTLVAGPPRRFVPADLAVAEEVGRRVALAMENALLFEAANRATRAREHLLAVVSHDLRNPLSAIGLAAVQIEREVARSTGGERVQRSAQAVLRSAQRMERLIGDLMDFSQLEFGQLKIEWRAVSVREVVEESLELLRPLAAKKGLNLQAHAGEDLVMYCDRERVLQILSNLVGNAIKFTPKDGTVSLLTERDGQETRFSVSDTGPGISEGELPKVFERFWRSRRAAEEGLGLGLAIVKGLVEAQHGRIWVESKLDVGTTFHFTVPLAGAGLVEEIGGPSEASPSH